jgi:hypothetical protein
MNFKILFLKPRDQVRYHRTIKDCLEEEKLNVGIFSYRKVIGRIMYAMLGTRPDLAGAVSVVSQFLDKPKPTHVKLVRQILQYIRDIK